MPFAHELGIGAGSRQRTAPKTVLYISGEESVKQTKLRVDRLGDTSDHLVVYSETDMDYIQQAIMDVNPDAVIIPNGVSIGGYFSSWECFTSSRICVGADENSENEWHRYFYCRACDEGRGNSGPAAS